MRILLASLLVLSSLHANATQSPCADVLEKVHAKYFTELEELQKAERDVRWGSYGISAAGVGCFLKTRSLVMCGSALGAAFVGAKAYQYRLATRIKALEDGYKMYEAYYQIQRGNLEDDAVHELMHTVSADATQERKIASELVALVDSGEICGGGTEIEKSWEDVLESLKQSKN